MTIQDPDLVAIEVLFLLAWEAACISAATFAMLSRRDVAGRVRRAADVSAALVIAIAVVTFVIFIYT